MTNSQLFESARQFFSECQDSSTLEKLEKHREQSNLPFSVCVAGSFSRGKTHLLNELLNISYLPESSIPTTTLITRIRYGATPVFCHDTEQKQGEYAPLDEDSLAPFSAEGAMADASGILNVCLPSEWLQNNKMVLFDTPGIDDLLQKRAAVAISALEQCDSALVTTFAHQGLGLTERAFIDSYLAQKAIPHIAIVITFLDLLNDKGKAESLASIVNKSKKLYPNMEVFCTCPWEEARKYGCTAVGIEEIRNRITEWSMDPNIAEFREKRMLQCIKGYAQNTVEKMIILRNNLSGDRDKRLKELNHAKEVMQRDSAEWQSAAHDFEVAGKDLAARLCDKVEEFRQDMRANFESTSRSNLGAMLTEKARDFKTQLAQEFFDSMERNICDLKTALDHIINQNELNLDNNDIATLHKDKIYEIADSGFIQDIMEKVMESLPTIAAALRPVLGKYYKLIHPIVILIEKYGYDLLKTLCGKALEQSFELTLTQACTDIKTELQNDVTHCYQEILKQVKKHQEAWIAEQQTALQEFGDPESAAKEIDALNNRINQGRVLIDGIASALA